jgi:hypothetical protein
MLHYFQWKGAWSHQVLKKKVCVNVTLFSMPSNQVLKQIMQMLHYFQWKGGWSRQVLKMFVQMLCYIIFNGREVDLINSQNVCANVTLFSMQYNQVLKQIM